MNKVIPIILLLGIVAFLANVTRLILGYTSVQHFGMGLQLLVLGSFWLTFSLYKNPALISWFGKSVAPGSYPNITIGKCFNLGFSLFGLLISLGVLFF